MVDNALALRPVGTSIEAVGNGVGDDLRLLVHSMVSFEDPLGIDNGAHELLDFSERSSIKLRVDSSDPVRLGVGVDGLDVAGEVQSSVLNKEISEVIIRAKREFGASLKWLMEVDELWLVLEGLNSLLESWVELKKSDVILVDRLGSMLLNVDLAKLADVVVLSEELVDASSRGDSCNECKSEGAHI